MKWRRSRWFGAALAGIVLSVTLPIFGHWMRQDNSVAHCALDGRKIEAAPQVRILTDDGQNVPFCCIHCAEIWLARQTTRPRAVLVIDENSGAEINAADAYFVRSLVENPATGSRIHVFRIEQDAEHHAERYHGSLLTGREIPLLHGMPANPG